MIICKQNIFEPRMRPEQVLPLRVGVNLIVIVMKMYTIRHISGTGASLVDSI